MTSEPFFSSDAFMGAVARSHFPGEPWKPEVVEVEGERFRVLTVRGKVVEQLWTHPIFYEPWPGSEPATREVRHLAMVSTGRVPLEALDLDAPGWVAPHVDWRGFASFEAYQEAAHTRPVPAMWKRSARYLRGMEREFGRVEFVPEENDDAVTASLFAWKTAHYARTGLISPVETAAGRGMYAELKAMGLLKVSSLRVGGLPVAAHAGYRWKGRFYLRLISYAREYRHYSPGANLLQYLLRSSFEEGDAEADFLQGAEPYKWRYATDVRVLRPAGQLPVMARLERTARAAVGTQLERLRQRRAGVRGG